MKPVNIKTKLSIQDAAGLFKRAMRVSWFNENARRSSGPEADVFRRTGDRRS